MRLFFALWPPREAAAALHDWAAGVRRSSGGRVTRPETIHLTLAFLGDVDESALPSLRSISATGERHRFPVEQARYWPHNRIVWIGPNETPEPLRVLVEDLRETLRQRKFKTEDRPFQAHVTLIRKAQAPGALPQLPDVDWPVREFVLVRSRLAAGGPDYEVLERFALDRLNRT